MPRFVHWLLFVGGLLGTFLLGLRAAAAAHMVLRAPSSAPASTVEAAPEGEVVRLDGLAPECETRVAKDGVTYYLAGGGAVLVQRVGDVPCAAGPLEGGFLPGTFTRAFLAERAGLALPDGEPVRVFTETLVPAYQKAVLGRSLPWLAVAVAVALVGLRGVRRRPKA